VLRVLFLCLIHACTQLLVGQSLTQYVNPFIGTGGHGHTFPGATLPFGMVQLSPDTRLMAAGMAAVATIIATVLSTDLATPTLVELV
jgi:putative alpha-1,2-mannosidase